jgi:hypothetical protein
VMNMARWTFDGLSNVSSVLKYAFCHRYISNMRIEPTILDMLSIVVLSQVKGDMHPL